MSRLSWDTYFLVVADAISLRSEDPKTKVGALLAKDNRIVSTGYNGAPAGFEYTDWHNDSKHLHVLHAELNCIVYAGQQQAKGCTLYVTHSPCKECAKVIAAAGIDRVVYRTLYKEGQGLRLLFELGVATNQRRST
jgi:dCMP deaminase